MYHFKVKPVVIPMIKKYATVTHWVDLLSRSGHELLLKINKFKFKKYELAVLYLFSEPLLNIYQFNLFIFIITNCT